MKDLIVFDLDGTLADLTHRLHYIQEKPKDWVKFFEECDKDTAIEWMIQLINEINDCGYQICICTGRSDVVRFKTCEWLRNNNISYDFVLMRKDGDYRHDNLVKPELLETYKDRVRFIVEDRASMVKKWRELGYNVLQCAEGEF